MTNAKPKLHFSRKLLAIPYAIFLALFVVAPLLIIVYYAFTNGDTGSFTLENFKTFFSGTGNDGFFQSSRFKTIVQSLFISVMSTVFCLLIAYPVAYIIAYKVKNKTGLLLLFIVPMWVNFVLRINALKELLEWIGIYNKSNGWNLFNTILGMVYDFLPFMILPIYTTFNHTKIIGAFIDECFKNDLWNLGSVTALLLLTLMFLISWLTGGFDAEAENGSRGTSLW